MSYLTSRKSLKALRIFLSILLLASMSACGHKIAFKSSAIVPAAKGYTKISQDNNGNNVLSINVTNLALPNQLTPPKTLYVVWIETERNGIKNLGQLKISDRLKGSLNTKTPFLPVRLFITAESFANLQTPAGAEVMSSMVF